MLVYNIEVQPSIHVDIRNFNNRKTLVVFLFNVKIHIKYKQSPECIFIYGLKYPFLT